MSDKERKYVTVISVIAGSILLSAGFAYADTISYDFSPQYVTGQFSFVEVLTNNTVQVHTVTEYYYPSDLQVPEEEFIVITGTFGSFETIALQVKESWDLIYNPAIPEPEEPEPELTPEQQAGIDEKIAELEQLYEDASTCKAYGTEGNSMFQSYLKEQISKEKVDFKSLPLTSQESALIKAHEACRVFFEVAVHISDNREMLDKFKAQQEAEVKEAERLKALEKTTVLTDPITEEDIAETISDAEKFLAEYPGFYKNPYGECEPTEADPDRCKNRGGQTEGAECLTQMGRTMCPMRDYNILISQAITVEDNYSEIERLVCEKYLGQYEALVSRIRSGDETAEMPKWLSHCEIPETDENE